MNKQFIRDQCFQICQKQGLDDRDSAYIATTCADNWARGIFGGKKATDIFETAKKKAKEQLKLNGGK